MKCGIEENEAGTRTDLCERERKLKGAIEHLSGIEKQVEGKAGPRVCVYLEGILTNHANATGLTKS